MSDQAIIIVLAIVIVLAVIDSVVMRVKLDRAKALLHEVSEHLEKVNSYLMKPQGACDAREWGDETLPAREEVA